MDNPFSNRATELLREEEAFLAIVSPEPVNYFLGEHGKAGHLYDRLVMLRGTPGSGKTTLARLFTYPTICALLRNTGADSYRPLMASLTECGAIRDDEVAIMGCRIPLETDYRDFWEFPYDTRLKLGLMTALIQSRAVLGWLRDLEGAGISLSDVEILPRRGSEAAMEAIGGRQASTVIKRACKVEESLYRVVDALVVPDAGELDDSAVGAYRPFDVIEGVRIHSTSGPNGGARDLVPLVVLDDAHVLHPEQFSELRRWLTRRELRVARWVLSRFDILLPQETFHDLSERLSEDEIKPGLSTDREELVVLLQSSGARRGQRTAFRRMAKDMASRYLHRMPLFSSKRLLDLSTFLGAERGVLSAAKRRNLRQRVETAVRRLAINGGCLADLSAQVEGFMVRKKRPPEDVRIAMLSVLMHRHHKRRGKRQLGLFGDTDDAELSSPVSVNESVYEAACLHLHHKWDRPYYCGIDMLCDASSENAEQFLQLSDTLVQEVETLLIRQKRPYLEAATQHALLKRRAAGIIRDWNFPHHREVRQLVAGIAAKCVSVTLEPNGWLTPNAMGVPQQEFGGITDQHDHLARVLQFAVAYNALSLVPHYPCQGKEWCLFELGGLVILQHGLALKRGGFVKASVAELGELMWGAEK